MITFFPCGINLALLDGGVWFAFKTSNLAGKIIVVALFAGSIFMWSIMITKFRELLAALRMNRNFITAYRRESHPAAIFLKRFDYGQSPVFEIYKGTCKILASCFEARGAEANDLFMGSLAKTRQTLSTDQINQIRNMAERIIADEVYKLESHMNFLATATTAAPFLGLLGTVWGVMDAFTGMAIKGTAMLSSVAPGIAGALLTTVIGLLVALPSSIGYNMLIRLIRRCTVDMENFYEELMADIESAYKI